MLNLHHIVNICVLHNFTFFSPYFKCVYYCKYKIFCINRISRFLNRILMDWVLLVSMFAKWVERHLNKWNHHIIFRKTYTFAKWHLLNVVLICSGELRWCACRQFNHSDSVIFLSLLTSQYRGIFLPHFRNALYNARTLNTLNTLKSNNFIVGNIVKIHTWQQWPAHGKFSILSVPTFCSCSCPTEQSLVWPPFRLRFQTLFDFHYV